MNICIVTPQYNVNGETNSGIANHYYELAHGLWALGHTVHVLFLSGPLPEGEEQSKLYANSQIHLHPLSVKSPFSAEKIFEGLWTQCILIDKLAATFQFNRRLQHIVETYAIDIVETTSYNFLCLAYTWRLKRLPIVTRVSTTQYQINRDYVETIPKVLTIAAWLERMIVYRSDYLVTHTLAHQDAVCHDFKVAPERFEMIPHGIQLPFLSRLRPSKEPTDSITVLYVGRFEYRKGIDVLLAAIPKILKQASNVQFVLVGKDPEGLYEKSFQEQWGHSFDNKVAFLGQVKTSALRELYRTCDLFVAPSRYESFGLVYIESMSYGKPVIGCRSGGVPEVVLQGETGFLVPPGNIDALVEKLFRLINNRPLRESMGRKARDWVERTFSRSAMAEATVSQYKRICFEKH